MTDETDLATETASIGLTVGPSMMTGTDEPSQIDSADPGFVSNHHEASSGFGSQIPDISLVSANEQTGDIAAHARQSTFPSGSLLQIPITVKVILGSARVTLGKMALLGPGSVLTLDQKLSEPVILLANGKQIAKGLLVILDELSGEIGISLTEIIGELSDQKLSA